MNTLKSFIEAFRKVQPRFSRLYTRVLAEANLTQPQYAVLLELSQSPSEPMTMTAISCKLYITKPAVTSLVDKLEKNGFLKRLNHPSDRRIFLIQIQPRGEKVAQKIQTRFLELMTDAGKQFNESERKTIQKFYSIVALRLDEVLSSPRGCKS